VLYEGLYSGIDLRLREAKGVPEYDLLLQPGADLSRVSVQVEGGQGLSMAKDGSLVIKTALGPLTQSVPKTWQVDADGNKRAVACRFVLLGVDRFGFAAPGWDGDTSLTIDPGLVWSTFLGGSGSDYISALFVDANGVVTVTGESGSTDFPRTPGAYGIPPNGVGQVFVSRLDPSKAGSAQLLYSTYMGSSAADKPYGLSVNASGVVAVTGITWLPNTKLAYHYPTTVGAYDTTHNGDWDTFVSCLDPSKSGSAQLAYSTFLGGGRADWSRALSINAGGIMTVTGGTHASDFPTTSNAYNKTKTSGNKFEVYVSQLDPSKSGKAQLIYSTFLGGEAHDLANALSVDANSVVTVTGHTESTNFPMTNNAYDASYSGGVYDVFVSQLDLRKSGGAQLVYSTYLGGDRRDDGNALSVDAGAIVTVAGTTESTNFPTTKNAYRTSSSRTEAFVSQLDLSKTGSAQLVYSTHLGGKSSDHGNALSVDASGVVTVAGTTSSTDFPRTPGAYGKAHTGPRHAFVSRLDPSKTGSAQLLYSTYLGGSLGGNRDAVGNALSVDANGMVTVAGGTGFTDFPTTKGAYSRTNRSNDGFISRLNIGLASFSSSGTGCKGSAKVPQLTATTLPVHGKTFTTRLSPLQATPAATPFMTVGISNQQWGAIKLPLDLGFLGMPGCKLFVSADVSLPLKSNAGAARCDLAIPTVAEFVGKSFYLQGLVLDRKANRLGVALSNAGKATIGF
jgi:hypothetical protein